MKLSYLVPMTNRYQNVKEVLKAQFQVSDRLLLKLKKLQKIYLNGCPVYVHHAVLPGDLVECHLDDEEDNSNIVPTQIPLDILFEDDSYLIINKQAGIPIHPSMEHYEDSLSNGVRFYFDEIGLKKKIRPVNRLDKDTTGLVVFAKNEYIQERLINQMQKKEFTKKYLAIVEGNLSQKKGSICLPIARKENSIIERSISENGSLAITHYTVLQSIKNFDLVECILETGKTHQIRVHFSAIGHPLLSDTLYGKPSSFISRQALHSYQMHFIHPITKQKASYEAPIPDDFMQVLKTIP